MTHRPQPGTDFKRIRTFENRERWYSGHVPATWDGAAPLPLVVAIHGATSNPRLMERFSGLSDFADRAGFAVIYPAGTGNLPNVLTWNGGSCCGYAVQHQVDDLGWLDLVLDDVAAFLPIASGQVFFAGMSNGAHMTYRYAAHRPQRLAAIACVAGPMVTDVRSLARPVPLVHIHGTDDQFAPFAGGRGPLSLYKDPLPSVPESIAAWVRLCGLPDTPRVETFPDTKGDNTTIVKQTYGADEVVLYIVEGGGHTWPGQPPLPLSLGKSSANMNANETIWKFFQTHAGR
jgi:polyhydroxybutyrate depolymerase